MHKFTLTTTVLLWLVSSALAQSYEDKRCKCVCPSISTVLNSTHSSGRNFFIANVPPSKCNCDGVVLPHLPAEIKAKEQGLCFKCECKYEVRNTAVIKVVVLIVMWVLALLLIYMTFILCLEMILTPRRSVGPYREYSTMTHEARKLIAEDYNDDD